MTFFLAGTLFNLVKPVVRSHAYTEFIKVMKVLNFTIMGEENNPSLQEYSAFTERNL